MLNFVFLFLTGASLLYGMACGRGDAVTQAMLSGAREGVETALLLSGSFAFFCGLMAVLRRAGSMRRLALRLSPALRLLLGRDLPPEATEYAALNLAANMLGMGNAATPMGLEAARRMGGARASDALCRFLVINATSVQLVPSTVIALRAAAGSAQPGSVWLPTLLATGVSTLTGMIACRLAERLT